MLVRFFDRLVGHGARNSTVRAIAGGGLVIVLVVALVIARAPLGLGTLFGSPPSADELRDEAVSWETVWDDPEAFAGTVHAVRGVVADATMAEHIGGRPTFLNLGSPHPQTPRFDAVIWESDRPAFLARYPAGPEAHLVGQEIYLAGRIEMHEGVPQIELEHPAQLAEANPEEAARTIPADPKAALERDAAFLAAPAREGRGLGSTGIAEAERFIAKRFAHLGLEHAPGAESYYQDLTLYRHDFPKEKATLALTAASDAGSAEPPEIELPEPKLGDDYRITPFSETGEASGPLAFAGYAVDAPDRSWSDMEELDLEGKVALAFRYEPWLDEPVGAYGRMQLSSHAALQEKARNARAAGAEALLVVRGPQHARSPEDMRPWELVSLAPGRSPFDRIDTVADIPTLHISHDLGSRIVKAAGYEMRELHEALGAPGEQNETAHGPAGGPAVSPGTFDLSPVHAELSIPSPAEPEELPARNVMGMLPPAGTNSPEDVFVIGAHHDHLGAFGDVPDAIYHGADDNASGVAALLELARRFSPRGSGAPASLPDVALLFVAFTAEEVGLLGSRAFVQTELFTQIAPAAMINLDMVGRNPDEPVQIASSQDAEKLTTRIREIASELDLDIEHQAGHVPPNSDHYPFHQADVPVYSFFTGLHQEYHDVSDTHDLLDYQQIEQIVDFVETLIIRLLANQEHA